MVAALVFFAKELNKYSKKEEIIPDFRDTVAETAKAIASGLSCLATAQLTNRLGSFYELVTGKSICDGSELSTTERVFAGVELALGTPKVLTFLGAVVGVGSFAKKAEKVMAGASRASMKVANMEEFFRTPLGTLLKDQSTKTSKKVKGKSVYRLDSKIEVSSEITLGKGNQVYLDSLHMDHLEVYSAKGKAITVLNFDGTVNLEKMAKAKAEGRRI
jgi:hypothetical protein